VFDVFSLQRMHSITVNTGNKNLIFGENDDDDDDDELGCSVFNLMSGLNWHSWSIGQSHDTVSVGVRRSKN